jgi:hypothetical protein
MTGSTGGLIELAARSSQGENKKKTRMKGYKHLRERSRPNGENFISRFSNGIISDIILKGRAIKLPAIITDEAERLNEGVSKSFRTGRLERDLQMLQLSAIRCSCIAFYESV